MRTTLLTGMKFLAVAALAFGARPQAAPLTLDFSTYFGGSAGDHLRDVVTDAQGNIYFTGGSDSPDYPTTAGAYDRTHNGGIDAVVTKLDPTGQTVIWSTYLGGPSYDRAYAIEVDAQGNVYVGGRAGNNFPTTAGAIQTQFRGGAGGGPYPSQDKFVAKLSADGGTLLWCTYFGAYDSTSMPIRDIALDPQGNVILGSSSGTGNYNATILAAFQNGYDSTLDGPRDGVIAKISSDGSQVLWATYAGGSGSEAGECSVRSDAAGNAYYLTVTDSTDAPTSPNAYDRTHNGSWDFYVVKVNSDGSFGWATYLGGSDVEHIETHELEVDGQGNVVVASGTKSPNYPTTAGAYDRTYNGTGGSGTGNQTNYPGDACISKLSADGSTLVSSTYVGGRYGESIEGVAIDGQGAVYATGATYSDNFPTTTGAFQSSLSGSAGGGNSDGFILKLSADLGQLLYGSYFGTTGGDWFRSATLDPNENLFTGYSTSSSNWPVQNAIQPTLPGTSATTLVKLLGPNSPGTAQMSVSPATGYSPAGTVGGPFSPASTSFTVSNTGGASLTWSASSTQGWLTLSGTGGTLAPGSSATVTVSVNAGANALGAGTYSDTVTFTNSTNGAGTTTRSATLTVNAGTTPTLTFPTPPTSTATSPLVITGTASGGTITGITWTNTTTGQSGGASGTTNWTVSIPLVSGPNTITLTVTNSTGGTNSQSFTVTYTGGGAGGGGGAIPLGGSEGDEGCGATGFEVVLILGLLSLRRKKPQL